MRHSLQAEAGQLGIDRACRFVGHKRGRDLVELFKTADAVVVPSRNEPFGIVILEAWSAGKPVIATQNGGPSEFVWHEITGLKIRDAVPSVAWGLQEMLSDTERAQWMGRNGRIAAETAFSWDAIAERTEQVYQRALDRVVRAEADEELEAALR
jgi:glycosyltransferase involved in cell wall biosynthesis